MTIFKSKGGFMKKDILDVKKYIRYDFDKPKSLYKIYFYNDKTPTIELINCYGVYKRTKDILIRRKELIHSIGKKSVTKKTWQICFPNRISSDLDFAKKLAVIEFKKYQLEQTKKRIESSKKRIQDLEDKLIVIENINYPIDQVQYSDSNKDIEGMSLF
jgi:hypothetical protein